MNPWGHAFRRAVVPSAMVLRAIFFDFGGTLGTLDPLLEEPWKTWVAVARDLRLDLAEPEIRRVNEEADLRFEGEIYRYHGRTDQFWKMRDLWAIDRLGVTSRRAEVFDALQAVFGDPSRFHLYPETRSVLQDARRPGLHLGVISNFTDGLLPILKFHRLEDLFDSITYSQAVGVAKPDIRVFRHALECANCSPEEALHVGDSWEADYEGALRAGLEAVWLNRNGRPAVRPCREIADLRGLLPMLGPVPSGSKTP
jgi:HAD superfamily hydrolase (TIGR01549 family)